MNSGDLGFSPCFARLTDLFNIKQDLSLLSTVVNIAKTGVLIPPLLIPITWYVLLG